LTRQGPEPPATDKAGRPGRSRTGRGFGAAWVSGWEPGQPWAGSAPPAGAASRVAREDWGCGDRCSQSFLVAAKKRGLRWGGGCGEGAPRRFEPMLKPESSGRPNVGKSTLFNALVANAQASRPIPFCTIEPKWAAWLFQTPAEGCSDVCQLQESFHPGWSFVEHSPGWSKGRARGKGVATNSSPPSARSRRYRACGFALAPMTGRDPHETTLDPGVRRDHQPELGPGRPWPRWREPRERARRKQNERTSKEAACLKTQIL